MGGSSRRRQNGCTRSVQERPHSWFFDVCLAPTLHLQRSGDQVLPSWHIDPTPLTGGQLGVEGVVLGQPPDPARLQSGHVASVDPFV